MEILLTTLATTATTLAIDFAKKHPVGAIAGGLGMVGLTALIGFNKVSLEALTQAKAVIDKKAETAEPTEKN